MYISSTQIILFCFLRWPYVAQADLELCIFLLLVGVSEAG